MDKEIKDKRFNRFDLFDGLIANHTWRLMATVLVAAENRDEAEEAFRKVQKNINEYFKDRPTHG